MYLSLTQIQSFFNLDWLNRHVVCTCAVSWVTDFCKFMKFYKRKSINQTFNLFLMPVSEFQVEDFAEKEKV